jgi:LysM repeat protein
MRWIAYRPNRALSLPIGCALVILLLSGCGQIVTLTPTSTPAPTPTGTVVLSGGPIPLVTATPAPYTPAPTATPTVTPTLTFYSVQAGDTLENIASQYSISVAALQDVNGILDPRTLQPGQLLVIPPPPAAGGSAGKGTQTPTPIAFDLQNVKFSPTNRGSLWILGEVYNSSAYTLEQVRVGVALLDDEGETLAEGDGMVMLNLVGQGEVAPFAILFPEAPREFESYVIYPVSAVPAFVGGYYQDLVVKNLTSKGESYASYTIQGTVRNTGSEEAIDVQVVLTAYDLLDRVIASRKIVPDHNVVAVGGETTFTAILVPVGGPVERIHAVAQGRRYVAGN